MKCIKRNRSSLISQTKIQKKIKNKKNHNIKIINKNMWFIIDAVRHFKDWMFISRDMVDVEILSPTLSNLEMMKEYNMAFVVKGFNSPMEYIKYDNLRFRHGFYGAMYATKSLDCMDCDLMHRAVESMACNCSFPEDKDIKRSIEDNMLNFVKDEDVKKINERDKYKRLLSKYSDLLYRGIYRLIKKRRVSCFDVIY